jgi:hypothetical protein
MTVMWITDQPCTSWVEYGTGDSLDRKAYRSRHGLIDAGLYRKRWHVYCKPPFAGADQVIRYLGLYTHRVAIANHRFVALDERGVTFRTKDGQLVTLAGVTFLARWLRHLLPPGFVKVRHYGLMSSSHATTRLQTARDLLSRQAAQPCSTPTESEPTRPRSLRTAKWREVIRILTGIDLGTCPACGSRALQRRPLPRATTDARAPPQAA